MKNNFPTEPEFTPRDPNAPISSFLPEPEEPEIMRKLDELHALKMRQIHAAARRAKFWLAWMVAMSVYVGWCFRAFLFA